MNWKGVIKIEKREKIIPIILTIVLLMLIFEFGYTIFNYFDYEKRVESGNERWKQVEERIEEIEECCEYGKCN